MPKFPAMKAKDVIRRLTALGFICVRQKGSHRQFQHPDGRFTTVPYHKNRDLPIGLVKAIISQTGLSDDQFISL